MGAKLCLSLLLGEILLAAWRIRTKSLQPQITAIWRGISLLTLVALSALSVVEWGLRYIALALALALLAAVSIAQLFRRKAEYRRAHILRGTALTIVLLFILSLPAMAFPEYEPLPATGGYPVKTAVKYFTDGSRTEPYGKQRGPRTLAVGFWYPDCAEGSFPFVVFSHGAFGTRASNETLFRELASSGYVVCSVDHTGQCLYTMGEGGESIFIDGGYLRELRGENAREDPQNSLVLYQKWMDVRVADIDFVIDAIAAQTEINQDNELFGLIDSRKIGLIGHSLGGSAVLGVGRRRGDIGAVVALEAPFLCDILTVEDGAFVFESAEYPTPVLNVYSDSGWPHLTEWPQYAGNARLLSGRDKDAYSLHLEGAGHLSLTDLSLASPLLTRMLNGHSSSVGARAYLVRLNEACLSFFNRFLKDGEG